MKTIFFGNGPLACDILEFLIGAGDAPVAVVVHPEDRARDLERLLNLAASAGATVVKASDLRTPEGVQILRDKQARLGISVMFGYILKKEVLDIFPKGCVNLHPAYLPYNRGAHPNVWSIIEGTPSGVTLHQIDTGIDTGPILDQREVYVLPEDTAKTLYEKLMAEAESLFKDSWAAMKNDKLKPKEQQGKGTTHRVPDLANLDVIDLDAPTTAREVIDLLRARTFQPYPGAYFVAEDGRKIHVRLELTPEE